MTQNLLSLTPAKELPADSYLTAVTALQVPSEIVRTRAQRRSKPRRMHYRGHADIPGPIEVFVTGRFSSLAPKPRGLQADHACDTFHVAMTNSKVTSGR